MQYAVSSNLGTWNNTHMILQGGIRRSRKRNMPPWENTETETTDVWKKRRVSPLHHRFLRNLTPPRLKTVWFFSNFMGPKGSAVHGLKINTGGIISR